MRRLFDIWRQLPDSMFVYRIFEGCNYVNYVLLIRIRTRDESINELACLSRKWLYRVNFALSTCRFGITSYGIYRCLIFSCLLCRYCAPKRKGILHTYIRYTHDNIMSISNRLFAYLSESVIILESTWTLRRLRLFPLRSFFCPRGQIGFENFEWKTMENDLWGVGGSSPIYYSL